MPADAVFVWHIQGGRYAGFRSVLLVQLLLGQDAGAMVCIGGEKLTKDRIKAGHVFSANLVTEKMLPMADYLGNKSGYDADKMNFQADIGKGEVLNVPVLTESPVNFELEVAQNIVLDGGEVFLCRIKNVLYDEALADDNSSEAERLKRIAPVSTTCETYLSYSGENLGAWGEPGKGFLRS